MKLLLHCTTVCQPLVIWRGQTISHPNYDRRSDDININMDDMDIDTGLRELRHVVPGGPWSQVTVLGRSKFSLPKLSRASITNTSGQPSVILICFALFFFSLPKHSKIDYNSQIFLNIDTKVFAF